LNGCIKTVNTLSDQLRAFLDRSFLSPNDIQHQDADSGKEIKHSCNNRKQEGILDFGS